MIVFAAWGPDPASPDPVTGTVEPVLREFDIKNETAVKVCLAPHHCDILPGSVVFSPLGSPVKSSAEQSLHCYSTRTIWCACVCPFVAANTPL